MNFFRRYALPCTLLTAALVLSTPFALPLYAQEDDEALLADGSLKTLAVVAVSPYESLVSDITFLGTLAGRPELGQMVEGGLAFFTQGKGPDAIDKTKPWGIIVQTDGDTFKPLFCLPVKNVDDLLTVAAGYGAKLTEEGDDVKMLELQNEQKVYVKHNDGWAFVSQTPAALANLPEAPENTFAKLLTEYDIAVNFSVKDLPESMRQFAIMAMQAGMQQQLNKTEDETDEQFEQRRELAESQLQQVTQMMNEVDTVSLGWAVDAEQQRTFLDFTYLVKPDSKLSRQLTAYEDTRTNFAGFYQPDAAATVTMAMNADPKVIEEDIDQFKASIQQMKAQLNKAIDQNLDSEDEETRDVLKTAAGDWFEALEATMKAGRFDAGAALQLKPDSLTLVAGAHVKDPEKIEAGLKKMDAAAKKKDDTKYPGIKWNAAEHAGINFHTITVPIPEEEDSPRKLLGEEANIAIGIGPEAVYLAMGRDNIEALNKAIDASAAEPDKSVPPFELAVSLGPVMSVLADQAEDPRQQAIFQKIAEMLKNEAQGRDHVRVVGGIVDNGLRYRIEVEEGVLRGIGKAGAEAQNQQAP